jgi:hypothetical protein
MDVCVNWIHVSHVMDSPEDGCELPGCNGGGENALSSVRLSASQEELWSMVLVCLMMDSAELAG